MGRIKIIITLCTLWSLQILAQNNVVLNIHHKLGDESFALNTEAQNNLGHDFNTSRLEYYISEISLVHDGGIEASFQDLWVLVDPSEKNAKETGITSVDLGAHAISIIEKVRLHIGVDPEHNHLDPSSYDAVHPLAPKMPSMHWGWSAGYRFVAFEGLAGGDMDQMFQLHGLGDNNYFTTEIEVEIMAENNSILIDLNADYSRALENIELNSGVIVHGDYGAAKQCLENFRDFVFSSLGTVSTTTNFDEIELYNVFPNPVDNGLATIQLNLENDGHKYELMITSKSGEIMQYFYNISNVQTLDFTKYSPGIYFVNLIERGNTIATDRIVVR